MLAGGRGLRCSPGPAMGAKGFDRMRSEIAASRGAGGPVINPQNHKRQAHRAGSRSLTADPWGEAHSSLRGSIPCWRRERTLASRGKHLVLTSGQGYDGEAAARPRKETCGHARRGFKRCILGRGVQFPPASTNFGLARRSGAGEEMVPGRSSQNAALECGAVGAVGQGEAGWEPGRQPNVFDHLPDVGHRIGLAGRGPLRLRTHRTTEAMCYASSARLEASGRQPANTYPSASGSLWPRSSRRDWRGGRPELRRATEGAGAGTAPARRDTFLDRGHTDKALAGKRGERRNRPQTWWAARGDGLGLNSARLPKGRPLSPGLANRRGRRVKPTPAHGQGSR